MIDNLEGALGVDADGQIITENLNNTSIYSQDAFPELSEEQKAMILES